MSEWTVTTLKEHFDALRASDQTAVQAALSAAEKAVSAALTSSDKANDKAESAQKDVNKTQNEFRGTLKDQAATLMPIKEAEAKFDALQKQITDLAGRELTTSGLKQGSQDNTAKIYAAIGVAFTILGIIVLLANGIFSR